MFNGTNANLVFKNATAVAPSIDSNGFSGNVYVPDALLDSWKSASGWSGIASRIKPLSEWTTT